jgi:F0F1-type ATP synthase alpha subunit
LEEVDEFTYLGSIVHIEEGTDADVKNRINKARVIFNILGKVWSANNISRGTKIIQMQNMCSCMGRNMENNKGHVVKNQKMHQLLPTKNHEHPMVRQSLK